MNISYNFDSSPHSTNTEVINVWWCLYQIVSLKCEILTLCVVNNRNLHVIFAVLAPRRKTITILRLPRGQNETSYNFERATLSILKKKVLRSYSKCITAYSFIVSKLKWHFWLIVRIHQILISHQDEDLAMLSLNRSVIWKLEKTRAKNQQLLKFRTGRIRVVRWLRCRIVGSFCHVRDACAHHWQNVPITHG